MLAPTVLHEDNHLLVVDKPAGIATAGVVDRPSVYQWAVDYIKEKYQKPGNVFIGVVSRLDTVTSGVLVLARTSKAASRLSDQLRRGTIRKTYLAILAGQPDADSGQLVDDVYKDDAAHRMRVVRQTHSPQQSPQGAKQATLRYQTLHRWHHKGQANQQGNDPGQPLAAVQVELLTGRKHQIRLQFSARGWPIWGDRKYDKSAANWGQGIALHAWQLQFEHPTTRQTIRFDAQPPAIWQQLLPVDWRPSQPVRP
jgi:23S rRNA pseudouridine1911/1915/1917 synthase